MTDEPPVARRVLGAVKEVAGAPARLGLGFFAGFRYPFRGARFVYLQHPGLVRFWIVPILITFLLLTLVFYQLGSHHAEWTDAIWASPEGEGVWASVKRGLHAVFDWGLTFLLAAAGVLVVAALASIIAAPFNDLLSEEVERRVTGVGGPPFTLSALLRDTVRTVRVEVTKLVLYACVMLPLFVLQFLIPVVGALLYTAFGFVFTATYFAVDYVDWPATRRGYGVRRRAALVRSRFLPMFGFGAGVYLFLLIPIVNLFFMPAAVAGGTLLFLDLEREAEPEPAPSD
ncbi:MAG: EI24 domain-containing protein [Sandaracinaceae bacterium]|nr:EI24 domain-containing protein [Myxococcales bacterium]MCB9657024.1 EI24 domain-containing protein [Sandaracinaceae bacterium]